MQKQERTAQDDFDHLYLCNCEEMLPANTTVAIDTSRSEESFDHENQHGFDANVEIAILLQIRLASRSSANPASNPSHIVGHESDDSIFPPPVKFSKAKGGRKKA
jgi:hypothetical protein